MILFLFFLEDCEHTLEPPHLTEAVLMSTHDLRFRAKIRKINVYPCKPQFYFINVGCKGAHSNFTFIIAKLGLTWVYVNFARKQRMWEPPLLPYVYSTGKKQQFNDCLLLIFRLNNFNSKPRKPHSIAQVCYWNCHD